jgi:hypothetical protein
VFVGPFADADDRQFAQRLAEIGEPQPAAPLGMGEHDGARGVDQRIGVEPETGVEEGGQIRRRRGMGARGIEAVAAGDAGLADRVQHPLALDHAFPAEIGIAHLPQVGIVAERHEQVVREGVLVELVLALGEVEHVEHHHDARLGLAPLHEVEQGGDVLVLRAGMVVPGHERHAVEPLEPVAERLVVHRVRVVGEARAVGDRELGVPDQGVERTMVDAPRLEPVADAADEAVDLQIVGHRAVDALGGRLRFGGDRCGRLRRQDAGEVGDGGDVLPVDRRFRHRHPVRHLQGQDELKQLDGIEVEILVQPRLRPEAVEMGMAHLLAQDRADGRDQRRAVHDDAHATASRPPSRYCAATARREILPLASRGIAPTCTASTGT